MDTGFLKLGNGAAARFKELPRLDFNKFRAGVLQRVLKRSMRVAAFFAVKQNDGFELVAVLIDPVGHWFELAAAPVGDSFASFTAQAPAFNRFEREIWENFAIVPEGHPWLKPLRGQSRQGGAAAGEAFRLKGSSAHEVAVGPVHAGVIEPGHFRFQCFGEEVRFLEISLGYQHRGVESLLLGGGANRRIHLVETASGDASVAQAWCHSLLIEALSGSVAPERGEALRAAALELERIANHVGDLGALSGDVAFLPTASFCGRLRGDFLNMTAELCGNRFGRGLVVPGGVGFEVSSRLAGEILSRLEAAEKDLRGALDMMFDSPSVLDRFENTGTLASADAAALGAVGVAARASGLSCDMRNDLPAGYYRHTPLPVAQACGGDVLARAEVRYREISESLCFIRSILGDLPDGAVQCAAGRKLTPDTIAVAAVEAWRGELCHVALTDHKGEFAAYKIVDPSFHNWDALALAMRGGEISDFPICNKSFNLSYCGHDL